jgi:Na+/melibiose symporter-like transporter
MEEQTNSNKSINDLQRFLRYTSILNTMLVIAIIVLFCLNFNNGKTGFDLWSVTVPMGISVLISIGMVQKIKKESHSNKSEAELKKSLSVTTVFLALAIASLIMQCLFIVYAIIQPFKN